MAKKRGQNRRKVRTREHRLAAESVAHVEAAIVGAGYTAEPPRSDYGYDLMMFTYGPGGEIESGWVPIQIKATDRLKVNEQGVVFRIDVRDYRLWVDEFYPVFLIVFDAVRQVAYWLYVQNYFESDPARKPGPTARTVGVAIPVENVVDAAFARYARERKADVQRQIRPVRIAHHA